MQQWKKQIGFWFFHKKFKTRYRLHQPSATSVRTQPKVLILFDATIDKIHGLSCKVSDILKEEGYKTELLGFFSDTVEHEGADFSYINEKGLSWFGKPKGEHIESLNQQRWDMLIALHQDDHLPITWVVSDIYADLKIGTSALYSNYDIVLEGHTNGFSGFPDHLTRILHSLRKSDYAYA